MLYRFIVYTCSALLTLLLCQSVYGQHEVVRYYVSTEDFSDIPIPPALDEIAADGTWRVFNEFLSLFAELPGKNETKTVFVKELLARLATQHIDNIPWYVSHGADHNIRTVAIAMRILEVMPEISQYAANKYGTIPVEQVKTLILLAVLLHDIGYPDLADHPTLPKFLHAEIGARMVAEILEKEKSNTLFDFLGEHKEQYLNDLTSSIRFHNADHPNHFNHPRIEVLPINTVYLQKNEIIQRKYVEASVELEPILFTVRFADNLDAHYYRLTPAQREEWFQFFHYSITTDETFKQKTEGLSRGSSEMQVLLKKHYTSVANNYIDQDEINHQNRGAAAAFIAALNEVLEEENNIIQDAKAALLNAKPGDFLHFYSNWIISEIDFNRMQNGDLLLNIYFQDSVIDIKPGVAIYQLVRAADAIHSCTINGTPLTDILILHTNEPKYFQGHQQLSLALFASDNDINGNPISPDPAFTKNLLTQ